jgi:hypothetical protein
MYLFVFGDLSIIHVIDPCRHFDDTDIANG